MKPPTTFAITPVNLDSALRYGRTIELFADIYRPDLSILEIGSGSAGITEFLRHRVTGVDAEFERTADRQSDLIDRVPGTAMHLPLQDGSYDVVLSMDMLEHIAPADRPRCFAEMLRVLRVHGRCIVTFPADESGERLDRRLNDAFRKRYDIDHPWVIEHINCGLPKTRDVVALVKEIGGSSVRIKVHKHLWGPAWWHGVHRFYTVGSDHPLVRTRLPTPRVAMLIFHAVKRLNFRPAYRSILVIDKLGSSEVVGKRSM